MVQDFRHHEAADTEASQVGGSTTPQVMWYEVDRGLRPDGFDLLMDSISTPRLGRIGGTGKEPTAPLRLPLDDWKGLGAERYPVALTLMFTGLMLAYLFLPGQRHPVREILPGIGLTMVLWLAAAWIYADYLEHFSRVHVVYAGIANAIIALIFLYITALSLILGGEVNQALIVRRQQSGGHCTAAEPGC